MGIDIVRHLEFALGNADPLANRRSPDRDQPCRRPPIAGNDNLALPSLLDVLYETGQR